MLPGRPGRVSAAGKLASVGAEQATAAKDGADRRAAAREAIERNLRWYHTIELAPGIVTPGQVDLRDTAPKVLPTDLSGKRALDVGTFDGFWAFELERRGADVVAIDTSAAEDNDWPPLSRPRLETAARQFKLRLGLGFELSAGVLQSSVRRTECDVYDLSPEALGGAVDLAFCGALLLHLRDPIAALERMREVLVPGGELLLLEAFSVRDSLRSPRRPVAWFGAATTEFTWWYANVAALKAWVRAAGFAGTALRGFHKPPARERISQWYCGLSARRPG